MFDRGEGTGLNAKERIREKFRNVPVLEVDSGEIRTLDKSAGVSKALIDWAAKKGILGSHANDDTGWDGIEIARSSIRNVIGHNAGDGKLAVLGVAPALIKTGVYLETTKRNEQNHMSHVFAGKVIVDGKSYAVGFSVNEDMNGRKYYNHELTYLEEINTPGTDIRRTVTSQPLTPSREPISSILRKYLFVK